MAARIPMSRCSTPEPVQITFIRHAQGEHNVDKAYNDPKHVDARLSPEGRAQAAALTGCIPQPQYVITSPLARAQETARIIFPQAVITIDHGCRERMVNVCDFLAGEAIVPETDTEYNFRVTNFIDRVRSLAQRGSVVVVSHINFINDFTRKVNPYSDEFRYIRNAETFTVTLY